MSLGFPPEIHHGRITIRFKATLNMIGFVLPLGYTSLNRTSFGMNTGLHRNNTTPNDQ